MYKHVTAASQPRMDGGAGESVAAVKAPELAAGLRVQAAALTMKAISPKAMD